MSFCYSCVNVVGPCLIKSHLPLCVFIYVLLSLFNPLINTLAYRLLLFTLCSLLLECISYLWSIISNISFSLCQARVQPTQAAFRVVLPMHMLTTIHVTYSKIKFICVQRIDITWNLVKWYSLGAMWDSKKNVMWWYYFPWVCNAL